MFHFSRCINIIFNSLLAQLVKYDDHTTRKIKIHTHHLLSRIIIFTSIKYRRPAVLSHT